MCPKGRMALRSLIDTPMLRDSIPCILISSPMLLPSRRRGDDPGAPATPPTSLDLGSKTLVTDRLLSRSYHSLAMMPLTDGVAPLRTVEWPTAVTVAA